MRLEPIYYSLFIRVKVIRVKVELAFLPVPKEALFSLSCHCGERLSKNFES